MFHFPTYPTKLSTVSRLPTILNLILVPGLIARLLGLALEALNAYCVRLLSMKNRVSFPVPLINSHNCVSAIIVCQAIAYTVSHTRHGHRGQSTVREKKCSQQRAAAVLASQ